MPHRTAARITLAAALLGGYAAPAAQPASPAAPTQGARSQDERIVAEFAKRVEAYLSLHKTAEATLPEKPAKPTSEQLDTHERALARLIARARPNVPAGNIFTGDTRAYFRRRIAAALSGLDGAQIRQSIMDENPGRINLPINSRYPDHVPLSTMPTQVLAALPALPVELEYRFIGQRLILLDAHAHLIVDYMDNALPR